MKYLLTHGHLIVDGNKEYLDGAIRIENDRIVDVFYHSNKLNILEDETVIDCKGSIIMPGFFDTHTHGGFGISFDTCNKEELDKVALEYAKSGTTSFLASIEDLSENAQMYENYEDDVGRFVGIHLEGPFLSPLHPGVISIDKMKKPDLNLVKELLKKTSKLKQMTIAYELEGSKEVADLLHKNNVKVMCGHSDALQKDLDEKVDGFTHLFNAMRPYHHRDLSLINAAFTNRYYCEVIGDGVHIEESVLKLLFQNIDRHKILLITDSSIARGLEDGEYAVDNCIRMKKGNSFKSKDGHLAGSVVSIADELKILKKLGVAYTDMLLYSSYNAYTFYGLEKQFGTLNKGKYADIVLMDEELNVRNVYCKGVWLYDKFL